MASGTSPVKEASSGRLSPPASQYETFIEHRVDETRRQVKAIDVAARLVELAAGVLLYLLAATLLDHWLIPGGLAFWGRLILWAGLIAGTGVYLVRRILPYWRYRINPIFVAQSIEQGQPSFKNSLINLLLLRLHPEDLGHNELAQRVYEGMQVRTAADLSKVPADAAVDRSHLIRFAYVLVAVVAFCALYLVFSPKNPLVSFGRVIWPWSQAPTPTRVRIDAIAPGDSIVFQGDTVTVSAEVRGLRSNESINLVYSSADGQSVDQVVPMRAMPGGLSYQCEVPPGSLGLQQDLDYRLSAGDCTTRRFHLTAEVPLAIQVDRLEYQYPAYTGMAVKTVPRDGDIRAVEGARVTIYATANRPIERATIELDADPRQTVLMRSDGTSAGASLALRMNPSDPARPEHTSYQLRFTDRQHRENRRPTRSKIEVLPDRKPEVRWIDQPPDEIRMPVNGSLEIRVRAEDPDFGLRRVTIRGERNGKGVVNHQLLSIDPPNPAHQGPVEGRYVLRPEKLGLRTSDRVLCWVEALDNKESDNGVATPNHSQTETRWIQIVAPETKPQNKPQEQAGQGGEAKDRNTKPKHSSRQQSAQHRAEKAERDPDAKDERGAKPDQSPEDKAAKADRDRDKPHDKTRSESQEARKRKQGDSQTETPDSADKPSPDTQQTPDKSASREKQSQQEKTPQDDSKPSDSKMEQGQQEGAGDGEDSKGQKKGSQSKSDGSKKGDSSKEAGKTGDSQDTSAEQETGQEGARRDGAGSKDAAKKEPINPETNPGDAVEKILKDRQKQDAGSDSQKGNDQQQGDGQKQDTPKQGEGQPQGADPKQGADQKQGGEPKKGEQSDGGQKGQQPGEKKEGSSAQRDQANAGQSGDPQSGQKADPKANQKNDPRRGDQSSGDPAQPKNPSDPRQGEKGAAGQQSSDSKSGSPDKSMQQDSKLGKGQGGADKDPKQAATDDKNPGDPGKSSNPGGENSPSDASRQPSTQQGGGSQKQGQPNQGDRNQGNPAGQNPADPKAKQDGQQGKPTGERPQDAGAKKQGDAAGDGMKPEHPSDPQRPGDNDQHGTGSDPQDKDKKTSPGKGGSSQQTDKPNLPKAATQQSDQQPKKPSGEPEKPTSAQGAGQRSDSKEGTPPAQGDQKSNPNKQEQAASPADKTKDSPESGTSPSVSDKAADTHSDSDGDRTGGGNKGGGQKGNQPGTGSAGSNSDAEQGGNKSPQQGKGETGQKAGDQAQSDHATGKTASQSGSGKESQKASEQSNAQGSQNANSSQNTGQSQTGAPGSQPTASAQQGRGQSKGQAGSTPITGGQPGDQDGPTSGSPSTAAQAADEANMDYARRQTDLAFEHLKHQLNKNKSDLLDELGWDRATAERFVRRWEEMKRATAERDSTNTAKRDLKDFLHSLGLRSNSTQLRSEAGRQDTLIKKDPARFAPPTDWADQFKAYTEGISEPGKEPKRK